MKLTKSKLKQLIKEMLTEGPMNSYMNTIHRHSKVDKMS